MFDMLLTTFEYLNNYVFGSHTYTIFALIFLVFGFMVFRGFSFDVIFIIFLSLVTVGSVWLFPVWVKSIVYIIAGLIIGYMISRVIAR